MKYSTLNSTASEGELVLVCCCTVSTCPIFVTALSILEPLTFTTESSCTKHSGTSSCHSSTIERVPIWRSSNTPNDPPISSFQLVPQPRLAPQQQLVFLPQLVHRKLVQQLLVRRQLVQRQLVQQQLVQR